MDCGNAVVLSQEEASNVKFMPWIRFPRAWAGATLKITHENGHHEHRAQDKNSLFNAVW